MKIFDESGNYLGEFIEDKTDEIKENVKDSFDVSFSSGCLMLLSVFAIQFMCYRINFPCGICLERFYVL